MSKTYETVIGLEVHVELATKTKIFCGCSTAFGGAPNSHTCPVCTGMPGSLPVLNKQVVEYAMAVGLATNCTITQYCKFDRKNYFYPDNPQNYQIPQLYLPICRNGGVLFHTVTICSPGGCFDKEANMDLHLHDKVELKKAHPCGSTQWEILRVGMDIKLKCLGCGHELMLPRSKAEKSIRKILTEEGNK